MVKHYKIKAFTLSEMMVVIALTTLVAGLAFSIMQLVQNQMKSIGTNYADTTQFLLLEQSLWIDFHRYRDIRYDPKKQQLQLKHELDSITYIFKEDYIIRDRDTFDITVKGKKYYYRGKMKSQGVIDALQIHIGEQQHIILFVFKHNDATTIMNAWDFN